MTLVVTELYLNPCPHDTCTGTKEWSQRQLLSKLLKSTQGKWQQTCKALLYIHPITAGSTVSSTYASQTVQE